MLGLLPPRVAELGQERVEWHRAPAPVARLLHQHGQMRSDLNLSYRHRACVVLAATGTLALGVSASFNAPIPDARFVEIPGAGHMAPLESPALVNAAILRFLGAL